MNKYLTIAFMILLALGVFYVNNTLNDLSTAVTVRMKAEATAVAVDVQIKQQVADNQALKDVAIAQVYQSQASVNYGQATVNYAQAELLRAEAERTRDPLGVSELLPSVFNALTCLVFLFIGAAAYWIGYMLLKNLNRNQAPLSGD